MPDDKYTTAESTAPTLRESSPVLEEKQKDAPVSTMEKSHSTSSSSASPKSRDGEDLHKVKSAKEVQEELNRVMSSGEGIEYPTGLRLTLIVLALCLSVFLMALVCRPTYTYNVLR